MKIEIEVDEVTLLTRGNQCDILYLQVSDRKRVEILGEYEEFNESLSWKMEVVQGKGVEVIKAFNIQTYQHVNSSAGTLSEVTVNRGVES